MKQPEIVDARNGDYVTAEGSALRKLLRNRISQLEENYKQLLKRVHNEIPDKDDAVALMVALAGGNLNERAMFFEACLKRAAFLEKEINELNTLGSTFQPGITYRITIKDAVRFGL